MKKRFLLIPLILLLIVVIFFLSLKPSLSPEDISLSYEVKNSTENHSLNLTLDIKENDIKYSEKNFYHVYIFPNENSKYVSTEYLNISQDDIHMGTDYRTYNYALKALENTNLLYISEAKNKENPFDGFFYTGHNYPITVNTYYSKFNESEEEGYIVFSYYEKKFFKNLSWTKVYPFKL